MPETTLDTLIANIYDAALEPDLWHAAIDAIRAHYRFQIAMLIAMRMPSAWPVVQVACNVPPSFLATVEAVAPYMPDAWGGTEAIARMPIEEPALYSQVPAYERRATNRWYAEWARPQGLEDGIILPLRNDASVNASLGLGVHYSREMFTDAELDELRLLAPHLRRATTISYLLDTAGKAKVAFASAFDAIPSGVVLVDADLTIIEVNRVAEDMLRRADPICRVGGKLVVSRPWGPTRLDAAIREAADVNAGNGRRGTDVVVRRANGAAATLHIVPVSQEPGDVPTRATAAIFIADADPASNIVVDAISAFYGLTPAEGKVFERIVLGQSSERIAQDLHIAPSTLRSHLQHIFDKTGSRRRSDLMQVAAQFSFVP